MEELKFTREQNTKKNVYTCIRISFNFPLEWFQARKTDPTLGGDWYYLLSSECGMLAVGGRSDVLVQRIKKNGPVHITTYEIYP